MSCFDIPNEIMLQLLDGKLTKAPLSEPKQILDIGTGTGIWAISMAERCVPTHTTQWRSRR